MTHPVTDYSVTNDSVCMFLSSVAMKQYRDYLKDCYRQPFPDNDMLFTTASKHYIELAVIRKKDKAHKEEKQFMIFHGLTRTLLLNPPKTLKEILKSECKPGKCVLIEGEPGIGKSTLAWEVCHKWEEFDGVMHYELVVLVRLREKKAQEARCLEDLLPCGATTNMKELVAAIGRGKGVLIVCDGFDELPDEQRQEGSVYIDLLKGALLPEATIIVTSRPSVSASLLSFCQHKIGARLELIGFTKVDIKRFAESVFSGDILEGFLSYITSNPPIYGMMYIPLNAVIVALIYQDSYDTDTPFPTTMTQLFDALNRTLIRKHLQLSHDIHMPPSLQCIKDIYKLPPLVAQQMVKLVDLAYNGMLQKTDTFELSEDFEHFGLMRKTTSLDVHTGFKSSYTFLHFTFQKYMAALHCAFYQTTCSELYYYSLTSGLGQNDVMRFVAGICSHSEYRDQPLYRDLVKIISNTSQCSLLLVHCAYECPSIMQDVKMGCSSDDLIHVEPVVGYDWYVTGYCINHFDLKWGLRIHEVIEENNIDLLVQGIRSSPVTIGIIQEMKISCTIPTSLSISQIFDKLKEFCQLQSLRLGISSNPTEDDALVMRQLIEPGSSLKSLKFWGSPNLIPILLAQSSLEELTIDSRYCEKPGLLPQKNTNLKKLAITRNLLVSLAGVLPNCTSLTCLRINGSVYKDDLPVLTELIQTHPTLEVLGIVYYDRGCIADLLQLVETAANSQLKQLLFSHHVYKLIPLDIKEQYKHVLGELP